LLGVGLLIRAALYFPLAMFPIDSDGVLAGLCAFRIAGGHYPAFFPGGTRLSAASCYAAAGFFHLVGPGRTGLALTGLLWASLYLAFMLLFLRATLGPKRACLAFLFAVVPSAEFMTVTYIPWGYGEIMASCAATLWLAALWRSGGGSWQRLCFGLGVGFGIWISLQTLMLALPAIAWVALKRRSATFRESAPALLGAIAGASPFLAGNLASGFPSLTQNWASRPASSVVQVWENLVWLVTSPLAQLLFVGCPVAFYRCAGPSSWLISTILVAGYALVAIGFAVALRRKLHDPDAPIGIHDTSQLLLLAVTACVLLYVASQAGSMRGWTVRYIAPLYVVVPLFCGIGIGALWRRSRWCAIATAAALLVPNLMLYSLPGTAARAMLATQLRNDAQLRETLARRDVRMAYGDYFWVYHLNFDSRERIAGIPSWAPADYFDYGGALAASRERWALMGGYDELQSWARAVGAHGSMTRDGDLWVFIADRPATNAAELLATLRRMPP
jgi:hypothetical protein